MSWLAPKLKHRIQIRKAVFPENDTTGGFDRSYETLLTIWAGIRETSDYGRYISSIRGETVDDKLVTHEFIVRYIAVKNLGKAFNSGFASGFDSIEDLNPLKSDHFIFLQNGSAVKGRLFRIVEMKRDDDRKEWFKIRCKEIEEQGTGAPS